MIAWLKGRIAQKRAEMLVVDVHGVGYQLFIPLSTFYELPELGEEVSLRVHMVVREDAIELFGFLTDSEMEAFRCLIGVAGIGPRLARNILSGVRPEELAEAVQQGDGGRLRAIPGVGKRTAERMIVELRDKMSWIHPREMRGGLTPEVQGIGNGMEQDVLAALMNLGYRKSEISRVLQPARGAVQGPLTVQSWLRESLRLLAK
jgi:Holliday junction DNA helicase RuvA